MTIRRLRSRSWAMGCLVGAAFATGCGGGGGGGGGPDVPAPATGDHTAIVLRDRLGQPIALGSKEPYSPRETCGGCHDVDAMANAYHFQQGRTTAAGTIQTKSDFYGDNRPWLGSDGMYGKW
ncbi:MAG: hypothetical protein IT460_17130 [Planctomycetes bacterium]|nr:hypothetical protein [Planctomycetota bacterium]